jgi:hypothetical protein
MDDVARLELLARMRQLFGENFEGFMCLISQPAFMEVWDWTHTFLERRRAEGDARVHPETATVEIERETLQHIFDEEIEELIYELDSDESLNEDYVQAFVDADGDPDDALPGYVMVMSAFIVEASRTPLSFNELQESERLALGVFASHSENGYAWLPTNASAFGSPNGPLDPQVRLFVLYARNDGIPPEWIRDDEEAEAAN